MDGREKPEADKCKEITNDWNYDFGSTLVSTSGSRLIKY
jgi:hypothetical protein